MRFSFVIVFLVYFFIPTESHSDKMLDLPAHKISMQGQQIGLRDALVELFHQSQLQYKLSNNITNDTKVSIQVKEAPWSEVFRFMVQQGKLNFRVTEKNRVLVSPYQ